MPVNRISTPLNQIQTAAAAVTCIAGALVLVLILGGWGAYQEWQQIGRTIMLAEVMRVNSQAERTAGRIESLLRNSSDPQDMVELDWGWLREHWVRTIPAPDRTHGALVRMDGLVVVHSDARLEGQQLPEHWQHRAIETSGPEVWETDFAGLTGGPKSLDIVIPIDVNQRRVADYHAGLDVGYLDHRIAESRRRSIRGWALSIGGILLVVLMSSVSLFLITRRATLLEHALELAHSRRLTETSQLIVGLAHEIRNPLNAVQLNLFTAERVFRGEATLDRQEVLTMLGESSREIERVEELIRVLLGYARPETEGEELIDVRSELQAVLQFLRPTLQTMHCTVETDDGGGNVHVRASRGAVRQVLLNLLNNAREAVPMPDGRIQVHLGAQNDRVELRVADNGPGIPAALHDHVFAPFYSTKAEGTGLGLAVVRSLVERAGGEVQLLNGASGGACFLVRWPQASTRSTEVSA